MEIKLAALKLLLEAIGMGTDISSKERRLKIQKSVYLMQAAGIKLGYSYSWYINGPYSAKLTRDYYDLSSEPDADVGARRLNDEVIAIIQQLSGIQAVPKGVQLDEARWLELLASVHYLRHDLNKDSAKARNVIATQKELLLPYYDAAEKTLLRFGLLQ